MPTPTLPLLHALLDALLIPIHPQTLSSTSPSLLLLILESINGEKLPLPRSLRVNFSEQDREISDAKSEAREVELTKCLLGTLDEQLSKDLTVVDPRRVVGGHHEELGVVIMALTVLARRRGVHVRVPTPTYDGLEEEEWEEEDSLVKPLDPDTSFSPRLVGDVFTRDEGHPANKLFGRTPGQSTGENSRDEDHRELEQQPATTPANGQRCEYEPPLPLKDDSDVGSMDGVRDYASEQAADQPPRIDDWLKRDDEHDASDEAIYRHLSSPSHNASSNTGHSTRTVLDDIIEEFGLAPDP